ncbi:hypothetical protein GCM10025771_03240 [Niveibacterium umoris]|uniref:Uncharacterized protein n=1 Tax=Niveibacterium umoris TaxID=1193620 RepID=A0A840BNB9_9RHOO|nr:hypothetical protein [Niveibacterium umoris]MBB4014133.1 hypothetical protein [Niveibacterium umoris]
MSPDIDPRAARTRVPDELLAEAISETQWSDPFRASDVFGMAHAVRDCDIGEFDPLPEEWA